MNPNIARQTRLDASLCFCAAAGQGLQTVEEVTGRLLSDFGFYVFTTREYMSRVRGGSNSTRIRVSPTPVRAATERIDWLFFMGGGLPPNVMNCVTPETKIVADPSVLSRIAPKFQEHISAPIELPLAAKAKELGGAVYEGLILSGVAAGLFGLTAGCADSRIDRRFERPDVAARNKEAFDFGISLAKRLRERPILVKYPRAEKQEIFMDGNTAVALGSAAAGCNFITAYPMSPGTALFRFFAANASRLGCIAEQAEDEIAAINMCLGASYAGARSMTTTSGGGFALMGEGLSLAGISETPVVVHLGQRPGPATGMATRTEQADLNLALYAGHGEFPRAIYAPVSVESAFDLATRAFATAAKFQTPAILLTDQYLLESAYDILPPRLESLPVSENPVTTNEGYRRYAFPADGEAVCPRGIPGRGSGLVGLDSHEHTEDGHISEDFENRIRMSDRRMKKLEAMRREALPPVLRGDPAFSTLFVCWGSPREALLESLRILNLPGAALASCEQVWPLSEAMKPLLLQARRRVFVEGNAGGQFARLVHAETGCPPTDTVLKYDGRPFTVEELTERIRALPGLLTANAPPEASRDTGSGNTGKEAGL